MSLHVVTGAFGFSGRYLAHRLLAAGHSVRTLTGSPDRESELQGRVEVRRMDFERPDGLVDALRGADVFYNTYWVRFSRRGFSQTEAVRRSALLFDCARQAGVGRIVHTSITRPAPDSPYEYFRGKAEVEAALRGCGVPFSILRPAVLYGPEDVLLNNIAWFLRRAPLFGIPGDGRYRLQPMHVDDFAALALREGEETGERCLDAVGPDDLSFVELVELVREGIGARARILRLPTWLAFAGSWCAGLLTHDLVLTWQEIRALQDGLLQTGAPPQGPTRLADFVREHRATLGRRYTSELSRRRDRQRSYEALR